MTAALLMGLERTTATRFSFLLAIPASTLAGLVEFYGVINKGLGVTQLGSLMVGFISSAVFSYLAIAWLLRF